LLFWTCKKKKGHTGHKNAVLCLALTKDGKYLASGSKDNTIRVWNTTEDKLIDTFTGHRDAVVGLTFRQGSHELYSVSLDRSVKLWNCNTMSYITTLFGHIHSITDIDCFHKERCLTSSLDKTVRLWKIPEQSQLVFSGATDAQDCVAFLTNEYWISGGQSGTLYLWNIKKKKPVKIIPQAHGPNQTFSISSIASVPFSDIIATGSCSGFIKLWTWEKDELQPYKDIEVEGWINDLRFSSSGKYLIAAVGRDQKLGRWETFDVNNAVVIISLINQIDNK